MLALLMLFVRLGVLGLGLGVMHAEGKEHMSPGVWFVVGAVLIGLAVLPYKWEQKS